MEGIIFPFNKRAKSGIRFNKHTEFGLQVFPAKPLLQLHLLNGILTNHGTWIQSAFETLKEGLFGRTTIDEIALQHTRQHPTGFSGGSMPHLVQINDDGLVTKWVLVEVSFGHQSVLDNQPGTTTAHIQAFFPGITLPDTVIIRGPFIMTADQNTPDTPAETPETPANEPVVMQVLSTEATQKITDTLDKMGANVTTISDQVSTISDRVQTLEDAPTRTLDTPETPAEPPAPTHWNDNVDSQYDGQSLAAMCFDDGMARAKAHADPNHPYRQTDEFFRAIIDKMRVAKEFDDLQDNQPILQGITSEKERVYSIPYRQIQQDAYDVFHKHIPYLQADEAMRTGFANFGADIIPTLFNSVMYHHFRAAALVWSNLTTFTAPSYPNFEWPVITSGPTTRRAKEIEDEAQLTPAQSPIPSSKIGTDNVTFNALGAIAARTSVSEQLVNASAAPLREAMMREFQEEMGAKIDWVLLNGDETAAGISHGNSTENTIFDKALLMDGLRKIARTNSDDVAHATIAITSQGVIKALMGARRRFGRDIRNLLTFLGPEVSDKFAALTEYQNINEVGRDLSTLLNGEIGTVNGIRQIATEQLELGDASGNYAGTSTTEPNTGGTVGIWGIVHKPTIKIAEFQALRFNIEFIVHARAFQFTTSWEADIKSMEVGGVAFGFNTTI